jgi:drug/metabolite transporter (DMT)-like permease
MELWIPITIFAAFTQNLRSSLQKYLKGRLSTAGATFSRFFYGAPLALAYIYALMEFGGYAMPGVNSKFLSAIVIGGVAQILATSLLVHIFSYRNFVVGTTFSKTETVQTALFGLVVLGETISFGATMGILVSLVGVLMISITRKATSLGDIARQCVELPALMGVASGALFGVAAIGVRAASLSLESGDFIIRAAMTLACMLVFQTVLMGIYLKFREPGQISAVLASWRVSGLVGMTGMLGSVGWFTAMTLQNAAYVRALGQIELVFTFAASYLAFRERLSRSEFGGIVLVTIGILILIFSH